MENGFADKECVTLEFLQIRNTSNHWGSIILIIILLAIFVIWYWSKDNDTLRWIITGGFVLIALFIIYSIYSTQQYFMKYGLTC